MIVRDDDSLTDVSGLRGRMYLRGTPGYEEARIGRLFNASRPPRFPPAVLEAESELDVVTGVRLARERGWKVAVRSGGHSWPAWSVRDDALLIDLGRMREIEVDPSTGLVSVQPAVTGGELLPVLERHGLMFQTGHAPGVGLGGYLLQGGAGWVCRGWGWACERIHAFEMVTADGELVWVDADQNKDLLWAARGAGHGFCGVVTRFELETRPLPAAIVEYLYVYPPQLFDRVMGWALTAHGSIPRNVEFGVIGGHMPGHEGPVVAVFALAFADTRDDALEALTPFADCPVADLAATVIGPQATTLAAQMARVEQANPGSLRYLVDSAWLNGGVDETVAALRTAFTAPPTPESESLWMCMGPRGDAPDMAFSLQTDSYFAMFAKWRSDSDDDRCTEWMRERMAEVDSISEGVFLGDADLAVRNAPFLTRANRERLEAIRARHDPDQRFCSYMTADDLAKARGEGEPSRMGDARVQATR